MENDNNIYDVIILGGGPSGMNAAIYAVRSGLKTVIVEKAAYGGQIVDTYEVSNYLGFENINGYELAEKMRKQVKNLGSEILSDNPTDIDVESKIKTVKTSTGKLLKSKSIILSMGAASRKLGLKREDELSGKGVSYCAICDGAFFKGRDVAVVGGGNTALEDLLYLSKVANKVYLIHRRDKFRADQVTVNDLENKLKSKDNNIELVLDSEVVDLKGDQLLEGVSVYNKKDKSTKEIAINGLFVAIGRTPNTDMIKDKIDLTDDGYIKSNDKMETNVPGVFVAGDIREKEVRQIITAASDGAIAATYLNNYLRQNFDE